jgi:N-methylhydantoinase A
MARQRVSMDIGGTFTDVISFDEASGEFRAGKASTTPDDLTRGVLEALGALVPDVPGVSFLVHGTTQGLNAFLQRRGERVLLLASAGAADTAHIARGPRTRLYDLHYRKPVPIVELRDIVAIGGRLDASGAELVPLDEAAVIAAAQRVRDEGYGSVAVGFLFSFRNPAHELRTAELLRSVLGPDVTVSLSHEAARQWREYERTSSALIEAYTGPVVRRYLSRLADSLADRGLAVPLHVMQSSGGVLTADSARAHPLQTLLSGPVGGAIGCAALAGASGRRNVIGVDMGGTSFDVSLVIDGEPDVAPEASLEGLPILMPVVNIHTVGAGGGSIAWVQAGGLRVGPRSAGASPGPACYGRGGTEPTVTDANLVLGRVDSDWFAGGQLSLSTDAAATAVESVGSQLGLDVTTMAEGICDVANATMAQAIRTITVSRGIEPRDFSLIAFGGAGPMHAVFLAAELGIGEVLVPRFPGAFSAWGMLQTSIRSDFAESYFSLDADLDGADLSAQLGRLAAEGDAALEREVVPTERRHVDFAVDIRYEAQEYTLTVPLTGADEPQASDFLQTLAKRFAEAHHARYGHANPGAPIEIVTMRATATGDLGRPVVDATDTFALPDALEPDGIPAAEIWRDVVFGGQAQRTRILRRSALAVGARAAGPAVILEETATTVLPPDWQLTVDDQGTLVITPAAAVRGETS